MSAAFGVHFGCTSACLAVYKDGKTDVVANDLGDRVTPSMVAFTEHDQSVGAAAKQGLIRNRNNTVCHVKCVIGREFADSEIENYAAQNTVKVKDHNGCVSFEVEYKGKNSQFSAAHISMLIYKNMLEIAQSHGGGGIQDAVLTVPLQFSSQQRNAICQAATQAGFNVLRMVSEPAAAALAYDLGQADIQDECTALVLRIGGISSDATLIRIINGMYRVVSTCHLSACGGDNFTLCLVEHLAAEFKRLHRSDARENCRSMAKLSRAAETCKHTLSTLQNAQYSIDSLYDGIDFHGTMSRARFESLCSSLVQECVQLVETMLEESTYNKQNIDKVIVCGGGTRMPLVQKSIADFLPSAELLTNIPPDEVIAIGAAKEAAILIGYEKEEIEENEKISEMDCLASDINFKVSGCSSSDTCAVRLFSADTPLPARKHKTFTLANEATLFQLDISESRPLEAAEDVLLAKLILEDIPSAATINCTFHLRREGSLHITCTEESSGKHEAITIEAS